VTIIRLIAMTTVFCLGAPFVPPAWADSRRDVCMALANVRNALYSMLYAKDKSALDERNAKVQTASAELDSLLAALTGADSKAAADFKLVWDQVKATRDKEIIPALYKGDTDDAKKIANGIQLRRLSKMWGIMSCK
jgi:hypothetical protein